MIGPNHSIWWWLCPGKSLNLCNGSKIGTTVKQITVKLWKVLSSADVKAPYFSFPYRKGSLKKKTWPNQGGSDRIPTFCNFFPKTKFSLGTVHKCGETHTTQMERPGQKKQKYLLLHFSRSIAGNACQLQWERFKQIKLKIHRCNKLHVTVLQVIRVGSNIYFCPTIFF